MSSVTATAAANWECRQANSGLGGFDLGIAGNWLISKSGIVEEMVSILDAQTASYPKK